MHFTLGTATQVMNVICNSLQVLVATLATAVLESYAIIVLDNTEQQHGVARRRPPLFMRDASQQEVSASESTRADVKAQSFRSSVIHKPVSVDGPGGLAVQDPPKGWPFSEVHVNFNSHMSENEVKGLPISIIPRPDDSKITQNQHQQMQHQRQNKQFIHQQKSQQRPQLRHEQGNIVRPQLRHEQGNIVHPQHPVQQQNPQQKSQQAAATVTNSSVRLNNGFIHTAGAGKFKQLLPYIISTNGRQQSGIVPASDVRGSVNEPSENIPVTRAPNSDLRTGYNLEIITPPGTSANSNQIFNVVKKEVPTSETGLSEDVKSLNTNKRQQNSSPFIYNEPTNTQNQASNRVNAHHNVVGTGTNYVWRDLSPGLEISSNAPQLAAGSHQIPTEAKEPRSRDSRKEEQGSSLSGNSATNNVEGQGGTSVQGVHVSNFDHANALGHSDNFGYKDAMASLPPHFHTGSQHTKQEHTVTLSPDQAADEQEQNSKYKSSDHDIIQNPLPNAGKSIKHMDTVLGGISESPGNGQAVYSYGGQYNQQPTQQQPQIYSMLPQASYSLVPSDHKVLTLNTGVIQGVPGAFIVGNGLHAGHHNVLLSGQGLVNAGAHGAPLQTFYFPMSGFHNSQLGNYQAQKGTIGGQHIRQVEQSPAVLVNSHVGEGIISIAPMPYLGLVTGGLYGNTGIGGLHLLQGNMLGIQGLQGVTSLQNGQSGGMFVDSHFLSSSGGLGSDNQSNLAHGDYEPGLQFELQTAGQQQQVQRNRRVPLAAGKNLPSFQSAFPYQHQEVNMNKQHSLTPQINVHPKGFGVNILQQHPVPQKGFKTGGYHGLSAGKHRFPQQPPVFPAYDRAVSVPDRGYQNFAVAPQLREPLLTASSHPSAFKLNTIPPQIHFGIEQEMPQPQTAVKREGNVSKPTSVPDGGTQFGGNIAHAWPRLYVHSNSEKQSSPASNYVFPTNAPYVTGLKPPTANSVFMK